MITSNNTDTYSLISEDASAEWKLVTTQIEGGIAESKFVKTVDAGESHTKTFKGGNVGESHLVITVTVEDLPANTILKKTKQRVVNGEVVSSHSYYDNE